MTLHQLRIFESVARHLNVTRASQELHMSQPAVSQQLKLLEQQCEARFIVRIGQGVELTERGRAFLALTLDFRKADLVKSAAQKNYLRIRVLHVSLPFTTIVVLACSYLLPLL